MGLMERIRIQDKRRANRARIRANMDRIMHIARAHDGEHCSYHNCTWLTDWPVQR